MLMKLPYLGTVALLLLRSTEDRVQYAERRRIVVHQGTYGVQERIYGTSFC